MGEDATTTSGASLREELIVQDHVHPGMFLNFGHDLADNPFMTTSRKTRHLSIEDLNRLESERAENVLNLNSVEVDRLLDLAVLFRNALREIQVCGNPEARQIASQALSREKKE